MGLSREGQRLGEHPVGACAGCKQSEGKTTFTDSEGAGVHRCSSVCALLWTHLEGCGRRCDMLLFVSGSLWAALGVGGGSQPWPQKRAQKCLIKG